MRALMQPRSVAVLGATERQGASSSFVMRNLIDHRFAGKIFPVHRKAASVFGYPAYARIVDLPEVPDVVVICIAAKYVAGALAEAGDKGIQAAVILSSGFAEQDEAGRLMQADVVAIASRFKMAVCGPNCLGLVGHHNNATLYSSRFPVGIPGGSFALISQSGAGAIALSSTGRIGFSYIVSAGNSAVTDTHDYLRFLANDPQTEAIGLVLEHIRNPVAFAAAMADVRAAGKRVVALYVGRSQVGSAATAAHTGALASSFDAVRAFCRRVGVILVESMDALLEVANLLLTLPQRPMQTGVALVGVSGGGVAHASDIAEDVGLDIPQLQAETVERLRTILPAYATPQNPLDTTGLPFADGDIYRQALAFLGRDPGVGLIAAIQDAPAGLDADGAREYLPIVQGIVDYAASAETPVVVVSNQAGGHHPIVATPLQRGGIPILNGTETALRAIHKVLAGDSAESFLDKPIIVPDHSVSDEWARRFQSGQPLSESEAKQFLSEHGIRTPTEIVATSADEAIAAAEQIGLPVVMKIVSADIPHKTEAGGVKVGLQTADAVGAAFNEIQHAVATYNPEARIDGISIQQMVAGGVEAIVGVTQHAPFGFGIAVGSGGVLVELLADSAYDLLPLSEQSASALVDSSTPGKLIDGFRGAARSDRAAFVDLLLKLSRLMQRYGAFLETVELNPVAVLPGDGGVCALDALVILRAT